MAEKLQYLYAPVKYENVNPGMSSGTAIIVAIRADDTVDLLVLDQSKAALLNHVGFEQAFFRAYNVPHETAPPELKQRHSFSLLGDYDEHPLSKPSEAELADLRDRLNSLVAGTTATPSAADLDAVAAEQKAAEDTADNVVSITDSSAPSGV